MDIFENFFDPQNVGYVQDLLEQYSRDPESVPDEWRSIFLDPELMATSGLLIPDGLPVQAALDGSRNGRHEVAGAVATPPAPASAPASTDAPTASTRAGTLSLVSRATRYVQAFRVHGHRLAQLDPLGSEPPGHPELDPAFFGTSAEELSHLPASVVLDADATSETLGQALERLRGVYTGSLGLDIGHLEDPEHVQWLRRELESGAYHRPLPEEMQRWMLRRLTQVEGLEQFLHRAYLGQKRFSLEGTDMMVPMLDQAIGEAARNGASEVVIGMAHRGRLNVLTHILGVPYEDILAAFEGTEKEGSALTVPNPGTGDVKYHHGAVGTYPLPDADPVRVRLAPNPSHLEFVDPVVCGMARNRQFEGPGREHERDPHSVVPILIHGDAAFAAEGVVAETLNLARLEGYTNGGTIHLIANNQIGFTTTPEEGRSTDYSSDLAKGYDIPIARVNADDPEACLAAVRLALAYRARFQDDFLIDLMGYRRHGHNEGDEPAYTQPLMYEIIRDHHTVREIWAARVVERGVVTEAEVAEVQDDVQEILRERQEVAKEEHAARPVAQEDELSLEPPPVTLDALATINERSFTWPESFQVHSKLARQLGNRAREFGAETALDWAHAETLAFGTLLSEGVPVRLTGQDSERGTFSQRHLVLHDVETGDVFTPLSRVGTARFEVYNSPLTETATIGFEYGYSVAAERDLVLWEAQFGDFVNVAQVMIDQFIAAGRAKWDQHSRLVLLLPHGYEGQGPEHSSARLERFLQLAAEDNIRVAYPTTPAQYFHLLRRQAYFKERPLVVMTPKSLLRLPAAQSTVSELADAHTFQALLPDPRVPQAEVGQVERLLLCSGKVYYDLQAAEEREAASHVAIVRLEALYPFPAGMLEREVARYPNLKEVLWVQEEPRNQGALSYVGPRLRMVVPRPIPLRHVSRPERASSAEGNGGAHRQEQRRLVLEALTGA